MTATLCGTMSYPQTAPLASRCVCGNGEAENDPRAVLRCPVHGADRSALLCLIVGHEAPYATDPPGRCRRPGCRAAYPPPTR